MHEVFTIAFFPLLLMHVDFFFQTPLFDGEWFLNLYEGVFSTVKDEKVKKSRVV